MIQLCFSLWNELCVSSQDFAGVKFIAVGTVGMTLACCAKPEFAFGAEIEMAVFCCAALAVYVLRFDVGLVLYRPFLCSLNPQAVVVGKRSLVGSAFKAIQTAT